MGSIKPFDKSNGKIIQVNCNNLKLYTIITIADQNKCSYGID